MSNRLGFLCDRIAEKFEAVSCQLSLGELNVTVPPRNLIDLCLYLREAHMFEQLIDIAGVDFLHYGKAEWTTASSTTTGFGRGVEPVSSGRFSFVDTPEEDGIEGPRFAVVYHLLSVEKNVRVRLVSHCEDNNLPVMPSIVPVWAAANWFEREAFDLFGILFSGHPDLRRILTDYGFVGHPFRKDFPLIGNVEMKYDDEQRRVVYQPVSIEPRVLVPRVIRDEHKAGE